MPRNLNSALSRRRKCGAPMQVYDRLPYELRQWLAAASLPWSPVSARRIWQKSGGSADPCAALNRLDVVEQAMLRRDRATLGIDLLIGENVAMKPPSIRRASP